MNAPRISVVVPAFNAAGTLAESLDSVLRQTVQDLEVLVVDDGSGDDTPLVARSYAEKDPRVRCFTRRNEGVSAARNFGARAARGRFLFFLDADDLLPENGLEERIRAIGERPRGVVLTQVRRFRMEGETRVYLDMSDPPPYWKKERYLEELLTLDVRRMTLFKPFLRKSDFLASGGYDVSLRTCEDWELWCRIARRHEIVNIRQPLYLYRKHPGSVTVRCEPMKSLSDHMAAIDRVAANGPVARRSILEAKAGRLLEFSKDLLYEGRRGSGLKLLFAHALSLPLYRHADFYRLLYGCIRGKSRTASA